MKTEGVYIQNNKNELVEVTDLKEGISQAKAACEFHRRSKQQAETDPEIHYFKDADEYWKDILFKLEKLAIQHPNLLT